MWCPFDVLQNPLVGRRFSTGIVFGRQSVNGNHEVHFPDFRPFDGNWAHSARHQLDVHVARFDLREDLSDLLEAHERFAAHERNVNGPVRIDQLHHSIHEFLSTKVTDLTQNRSPAEMLISIGIAAWACERTLFSDFYREERGAAR